MQNLTYKILEKHLLKGKLEAGQPIEIKMDQTLTQDATGTMAYMQFEAMGVKKVKTELSVSYVDHNTLQNGFMNADDHAYLQSVASKYGIYFSKTRKWNLSPSSSRTFCQTRKDIDWFRFTHTNIFRYGMYRHWCWRIGRCQSYGRNWLPFNMS